MNKLSQSIRIGIFLGLSLGFISCDRSQDMKKQPEEHCDHLLPGLKGEDVSEAGISLGGFRFASSGGGEAFAVYDSENLELVPPGAALATIRKSYWVGFYDGGGVYYKNGKKIILNKIFFVIEPNKKIAFYAPDIKYGRFFGDKISEKITFN